MDKDIGVPADFASRVIGNHVIRLRALLKNHRDEVEAISSHDLLSFQEYQSGKRVF